jgi:hypothetical protein
MKSVRCSVMVLAVTALAFADGPPGFEAKPSKPEDKVIVNKEGTIFRIQSKTGVGGAVVSRTAGAWPKRVAFHFQYTDGKPFKGLESFKLHAEKFKLEGSLKQSGKFPFLILNKEGKFTSIGTVKVPLKQGKEAIEVLVPGEMLYSAKGAKALELSWVDVFRD